MCYTINAGNTNAIKAAGYIYKLREGREWEMDEDSAEIATGLWIEHRHFRYGGRQGVKRLPFIKCPKYHKYLEKI